jgi:O-antigen ligase
LGQVASKSTSLAAPIYLLACLLLGGSAQGIWQNAVLQLAGLAIIGWTAFASSEEPLSTSVKQLLMLAMAAIAVAVLQLVPLPASLWAHGERAEIADGYHLLGRPLPSLPVSLTPYDSIAALLGFIPALALFLAVVRFKPRRAGWLAAAVLAGAVLGTMLGALQVASGAGNNRWYLYRETNLAAGVGFFANANHMATLLVVSLPFIAALATAGRGRGMQRYSALLTVLAGVALIMLIGIALNGSLAGYALALPVLGASVLILLARSSRYRRWAILVAALAAIAAAAVLASSSVGSGHLARDANTSVQSRESILATTGKAIIDYMPLGSGLGSFVKVYRLYESPDSVSSEYVIHADNDYAEIALELGAPGIILMLLFLGWWLGAVTSVWHKGEGGPFAQAASIASAAVLVHSLVEFPLRTAAISGCFAVCLALIADRRAATVQEPGELRPARHVVIG